MNKITIVKLYIMSSILLTLIMLSGCAKGFEPLEHKVRDKAAELNEGFEYSAVHDIWKYENKRYDHLSIEENAYNENKQEMLYDFDVKVNTDNLKYVDNIGKILVGEDYEHDKWNIETFNYGTEEETKEYSTATYRSEDFQLICDSTSLMYIPKGKSFDIEILPPDTYDEAYPEAFAENAVEIINRLYKAMEKTPPEIYGAVYLEESDLWEFDFRQNVNGLSVTDISFRRVDSAGNIVSDEFNNIGFYGKCSVIIGKDGEFSVYINQYYLDTKDITKEYDTAITLDSALEFIDENLAKNSNYTVKNADLQYMLVMQEIESADKNKVYGLKAVPVWVFELINYQENQRYCSVINAVSGDCSFVKANGDVDK